MRLANFLLLITLTVPISLRAEASGFSWKDEPGVHRDLLLDGKPVAQYVYEKMDPERREETYKPFHHAYDQAGEDFITKGPGGKFTHHRGIYFGFMKCGVTLEDGTKTTVDTWHCKKAYQTHEEFLVQEATGEHAVQKVKIAWRLDDGTVFAWEKRQLTFHQTEGGLQIDFTSTVETNTGHSLKLDGDPQHAGFQFRASNEVAESTADETYYIRPGKGKGAPGQTVNVNKERTNREDTVDLPWKGMSFVTGGQRYSVMYLDHPGNPKPAFYSERDYGRFGSYFVATVEPEVPVAVQYRLIITPGEFTADEIEAAWQNWTGS